MTQLPTYIAIAFMLITALSVILFYLASKRNKLVGGIILLLMLLQGIMAANDFFTITDTLPPRIVFAVLPAVILIVVAFVTGQGRAFTDGINPETYTWLHTIRIAVEFVLLGLFLYGYLPQSMTFEGRNFDLLSGLSAPLIAWFGFRKKQWRRGILIAWNMLCLGLVLQVMITGVLSVPSVIQTQAFDRPNVAVLYFPFIWLPGIVVPIVVYGHLAVLRQLLRNRG